MAKAKLPFFLHRSVIVLACLTLLTLIMQAASWFSLGQQMTRSKQIDELTHTLARQVAFHLTTLMENGDENQQKIQTQIDLLTENSRILDATVYDNEGVILVHSGETINLRDRLAINGKRAGSYFNHQIVEPIAINDRLLGFLRMTLDTHIRVTEAKQVDNTTNVLRLMLLLALAIGIILTRTLLRGQPTHWQQSPYLLTASMPVQEQQDDKKKEKSQW